MRPQNLAPTNRTILRRSASGRLGQPHSTPRSKTGLEILTARGIPDGAKGALLGALAFATAAVLIGGLQLGSWATVPDIVSPTQFWLSAILLPLAWSLLCTKCFGINARQRTILVAQITALEFGALTAAYFIAPAQITHSWKGRLPAGAESSWFAFNLPATSTKNDVVFMLKSNPPGKHMKAYIHSARPNRDLDYQPQMAPDAPYPLEVGGGPASIKLVNFTTNPAVDFELSATYVARRYHK